MEPVQDQRVFWCACSAHCGEPKKVSKATYNRHANAREYDLFTPELRDLLQSKKRSCPTTINAHNGAPDHPRNKRKGKEKASEIHSLDTGIHEVSFIACFLGTILTFSAWG